MSDLRIAATELLPLDADRREEALVHLAFLAQAAVAPELSEASEGAAERLQEPLAARIAYLVRTGELEAKVMPLLDEYRAIVVEDTVGLWDAWPDAVS